MSHFLVVDDDPAVVKGMTVLLRDDGHSVAPFTGGAAAVDALAGGSFDVVVTDLEMPRVDGRAVVEAARRHHPAACLIVVTARPEQDEKALSAAGACHVADKPLDYEGVMQAIAECRARGGPGPHGRCQLRSRTHGPEPVRMRRK